MDLTAWDGIVLVGGDGLLYEAINVSASMHPPWSCALSCGGRKMGEWTYKGSIGPSDLVRGDTFSATCEVMKGILF
jgi:hypothetical protein